MYPYGPFLCLPRWLFLLIAGPEETKNLAGQEILRLIQNPLSDQSFTAVTVKEDIGL